MARYSPEHKEETRRRMIATAGRRFKSDGIDGSGIATLVADAGLTNGAFYGHFDSKDDLVATVVAQQLAEQVAVGNSLPPGLASAEAFLREGAKVVINGRNEEKGRQALKEIDAGDAVIFVAGASASVGVSRVTVTPSSARLLVASSNETEHEHQ